MSKTKRIPEEYGNNLIIQAVKRNWSYVMQIYEENSTTGGVDFYRVGETRYNGDSLLHIACTQCNFEMASFWSDIINVNKFNCDGYTPLHALMLVMSSIRKVDKLIQALRILKLLLDKGADINIYSTHIRHRYYGYSPYMVAVMNRMPRQILDILKNEYGANFSHVRELYHLKNDENPW